MKTVNLWRVVMIRKFIFYFLAFAFDIFAVNFFVDPVIGTAFFAVFGELEGVWSVLRIVILMIILMAACLGVNSKDTTMLEICDSEINACRVEGTKIDPPKPSDFKAYLGENYAFGALGVFMLAYISPAILVHGELWYFIPAVIIIGSVVAVYVNLNRRFAQSRLDSLMVMTHLKDEEENPEDNQGAE
jgi:hypothetical protein